MDSRQQEEGEISGIYKLLRNFARKSWSIPKAHRVIFKVEEIIDSL